MSAPNLYTITPQGTEYTVYTDGGARGNPGPAAAAYIIQDERGRLIHQAGQFLGETTNNVAEYAAVKLALERLISHPPPSVPYHLRFLLDSQLVASQLSGQFKIKQAHLLTLVQEIRQLLNALAVAFTFKAIPRAQNSAADALVNQVLDAVNPSDS